VAGRFSQSPAIRGISNFKEERLTPMKDIAQTPSLRNRLWQEPKVTNMQVDALIAGGANALTAPILAARDADPETVATFLAPTIRQLLPNPSFFLDMDKAADRLVQAITNNEAITIWSDYDVDGATSAATLGRFLRDCGHTGYDIYIPDRIVEGYGPNAEGLLALKAAGAELVCILDSGTVAIEPLTVAHEAGLDVVVIDHHAAEDQIPPAVAVVNPNRLDQEGGYEHVCAAGMTFILTVAVNMRLRKMNWFSGEEGRPEKSPDLMSYLDLVALGTVCDVVPLTTINRAFVMRGLPYLTARQTPGVKALAAVAACNDEIDASACGFRLGPRINAGGRIGESGAGAALLLETDPEVAESMAKELNELNIERQEMEKACTAQALEQVKDDFIPGTTRKLALAIVDAHEGIVGISAARMKETYDAPSFVLAPTPEGTLKGSGRSVSGFDLGAAIIAARKAGLLIKGGGHAMAGGISIQEEKVPEFVAFINAEIEKSDYFHTGVVSKVDAKINIEQATTGLIDAAQSLAPFGMGNASPRFVIQGVIVADVRVLKEKHLKIIFEDPEMREAGKRVEGLIWNCVDTPFGDAIQAAKGKIVDVLGGLEINEWNGNRRVQIKLDDLRFD
jgi:single-stranded-DNA-specific exonuclease